MLQLPTIEIGGRPVQLPCSLAELSLLTTAAVRVAGDESRLLPEYGTLFRRSPSLFIFALVHAVSDTQHPANDSLSFARWVRDRFVAQLHQHRLERCERIPSELRAKRFRQSSGRLANAASPVAFVKGLNGFLKSLRLGIGEKKRDRFLQTLNASEFCADFVNGSDPIEDESLTVESWFADKSSMSATLACVEVVESVKSAATKGLRDAKLLAMKQLAYGASHEINNPLANIATRAQSLLADELHPDRRRKLAVIYEQAMRAHQMISDLMLFGHPADPRFEEVNVSELLGHLIKEMRTDFRRLGIATNIASYPGTSSVEADPTQLGDALKALLKNSMESIANHPGIRNPSIQLRVWPGANQDLWIAVQDNGPGVSEVAADHLFDPFYSGREAGRGLGFGLSKAWTILVRLHGGQLEWLQHSGADRFRTEFRIRLPIRQPKNAIETDSDNPPSCTGDAIEDDDRTKDAA